MPEVSFGGKASGGGCLFWRLCFGVDLTDGFSLSVRSLILSLSLSLSHSLSLLVFLLTLSPSLCPSASPSASASVYFPFSLPPPPSLSLSLSLSLSGLCYSRPPHRQDRAPHLDNRNRHPLLRRPPRASPRCVHLREVRKPCGERGAAVHLHRAQHVFQSTVRQPLRLSSRDVAVHLRRLAEAPSPGEFGRDPGRLDAEVHGGHSEVGCGGGGEGW